MKLTVLKEKYDQFQDTLLAVLTKESTNGMYTVIMDPELAFKEKLLTEDELRVRLAKIISTLLQEKIIRSISYNERDIKRIFREVQKLDKEHRTVKLDEDLSLIVKHPEFEIRTDAWDKYTGYKLTQPVYWARDKAKIEEEENFYLELTEEQETELNVLADEQRGMMKEAFVFPWKTGYILFIHSLDENLIESIKEKGKVKYNTMGQDGIYYTETLTFVKTFFTGRTDEDEDEDIMFPYSDLKEKGYEAYKCHMFTLPPIEQLLKMNDINVIGLDNVYPEFPEFEFEFGRLEDNPDYLRLPFQDKAFKNWEDNGRLGTIALPTGSGKTLIALRAIQELKLKTLIVTPTIEMLYQWRDFLITWLSVPKERIGLYYADEKLIKDITIITFQSGHRKIYAEVTPEEKVKADETLVDEIGKLSSEVGLMIMDEGHHAPAPIFQRIMINLKSRYRMSLTATPYREDKNEVLAFLAIGDVVHTEDYATLAEQEVVCPIDFQRVEVPFTSLEKNIINIKAKFRAGSHYYSDGYSSRVNEKEKQNDTEKLLELWKQHTFVDLKQRVDTDYEVTSTRQIYIRYLAGFAEDKFTELLKIVKENKDSKILIFNEFVDGAKMIAVYLEMNGIECHVLTGSTIKRERAKLFKAFRDEPNFILTTTTVLDEGINVPDCDVVIIFNASRSKRQMIQRVGRGCRYRPGKVERVYELIAVPEDIRRERSSRRFYWQTTPSDEDMLKRMQEKRASGGRVTSWKTQRLDSSLNMAIREIELYEYEKALYRDITDVINVEKQQELIKQLVPELWEKVKNHYEVEKSE